MCHFDDRLAALIAALNKQTRAGQGINELSCECGVDDPAKRSALARDDTALVHLDHFLKYFAQSCLNSRIECGECVFGPSGDRSLNSIEALIIPVCEPAVFIAF